VRPVDPLDPLDPHVVVGVVEAVGERSQEQRGAVGAVPNPAAPSPVASTRALVDEVSGERLLWGEPQAHVSRPHARLAWARRTLMSPLPEWTDSRA
jgi:hypothetical protein